MNVVSLQELVYCTRNLPFKIIHDDQCLSVFSKRRTSSCHIWYNDVFNILDCGFLVCPVFGGMSDIPIGWELIARVTAVGYSSVDHLDQGNLQ